MTCGLIRLCLMLALLSLPAAAAEAQALQLSFVDTASDVVGRDDDAMADGRPDGHFRLYLDVGNATRTVDYIVLHSANDDGRPSGGQVWDTAPNGYPILAVEREGRRLNKRDADIADQVWRRVAYDIYGSDTGWFTKGQHFTVLMRFKDGGQATATTEIGGAAGGPVPGTDAAAYRWRWVSVDGNWKSDWRRRQPEPTCELTKRCTCYGHDFCGTHPADAVIFRWPDGCNDPPHMIRCTAQPE